VGLEIDTIRRSRLDHLTEIEIASFASEPKKARKFKGSGKWHKIAEADTTSYLPKIGAVCVPGS